MCELAARAPDFVRPDFQTTSRLLRLDAGQSAAQALPVPRSLQIGGDYLRLRVVRQILEEVRRVQVGLVADADDLAEGEAAAGRPHRR